MAFGRTCLIGDAAFAVRPHAAAGTAKAAEDGWVLAEELASADGDVPRALERVGRTGNWTSAGLCWIAPGGSVRVPSSQVASPPGTRS
jgi:hypothetical protein